MPPTIVPYTKAMEREVIDLILWSQNVEFNVPITLADQPDLLDVANVYQRGAGNFWVALDGERVIGTIALVDIGDGVGALKKMFVHPEFRGAARGIAAALLATLLASCRAHAVATVYLGTVDVLHAAHRFYAKHGFVAVAPEHLPASFPRMGVDTMFFRYDLP